MNRVQVMNDKHKVRENTRDQRISGMELTSTRLHMMVMSWNKLMMFYLGMNI